MEKYLEVLTNNKVHNFYHFTNIVNLNSILRYGILSRKELELNNIKYSFTDRDRFDEQFDCISLSLDTTNRMMLYKKMNHIDSEWIIFEIDAKKLIEKHYDKIFYCKYNAASNSVRQQLKNNKDYMRSSIAFNNIFVDNNLNNQAELLVKKVIEVKLIKRIIVYDISTKLMVEKMLENNNIKFINVVVKKEMYK